MRALFAMIALTAGSCSAWAQAPLSSFFGTSSEGWNIETRTNPTGAFSLVQVYTPDYRASGGVSGGYIEELDPDSNWSFFRAPETWLGNRSAFAGRRLEFFVRTDTLNYPDGRLVVLIGNGGQRISHATELPPVGEWTFRSIPLSEGQWRLGSAAAGAVATQAQINAVLGSLERLLIGMEYGGDQLEERVGLDSVIFGVCPGDFDRDGFVDFFDFDAFVGCFEGAGCPPGQTADFDRDGFVDFFDFDAFVAAFEQGC